MNSTKDSNLELQLQQIENILDVLKQQLQGIKKYNQNVPVMELELLQHNVNTLSKSVAELPVEKKAELKDSLAKQLPAENNFPQPVHNDEDLLSEIGAMVSEKTRNMPPDVNAKNMLDQSIDAKLSELSIHERIAENQSDNSLATHHQTKKLESLKSTIGLNEKFLFISDLFHGKNDLYTQAIKQLDGCKDLESAIAVVNHHIPISDEIKESAAYNQFVELLYRRYES